MGFEYFAPLKSFQAVNGPSIQEKEVNWALSSEVRGQGEKIERENPILGGWMLSVDLLSLIPFLLMPDVLGDDG